MKAYAPPGCTDLVLLKCTSTYPASPLNSHIRTIAHLRELFGCQVGLSDHTMGVGVSVAAVAMGATVIEKHFTLNRADGGVDASFSLEPHELASLVVETERAWQSLGQVQYGVTAAEQKSLQYRRSLYVVRDMLPGEVFSKDNVRAIRPGRGLAPKHLDAIIGRKARCALTRGTALHWDQVE
jgi:N-acetylneuraminate synthase